MVRNGIVNFCSVFLDERVLVSDVEHMSGIGEIIIFYIIFIYLNEHKNVYSRIQQSLKFILIYNLNLNLRLYFYLRARSLLSMLGVDFYFPWLFTLFSELDHPGRVSKYN